MEDSGMEVLVFPWLALGHMLPFLEVSKEMAKRGHRVTFVSTPRNIERLPKLPQHLAPRIQLQALTMPHVDGLPENAEATVDVPADKVPYLKKAYDGLQQSMVALLERSRPGPDWIIHDFTAYWLPGIAATYRIPCAFFCIFSAPTIA
ncbi:hypothetical protein ACLOJK_032918 [Asimina triloba]